MAIQDGFDLITNMFTSTTVFSIDWLLSVVFVAFTLLLITRDIQKWKVLAFPVTVLWHIVGITPSFIFYVVTGILFVISAFSLETIGNLLTATIRGEVDPAKREKQYNESLKNARRKKTLQLLQEIRESRNKK